LLIYSFAKVKIPECSGNVPGTFPGVLECSRMFMNVPERSKISLNVPGRLTLCVQGSIPLKRAYKVASIGSEIIYIF
jgi:hypothetical protein